jgi:hypothetical protein
MPELALEARPMSQVVKRLIITAVLIIVGVVSFNVGSSLGAAKQSAVDQTEFTAWRNANACVEVPGFLRGDANGKTYPKKHGVQ